VILLYKHLTIIEREILLFLHELGLSVRKNATYTYMEIHVLIIK